jgi:hypothetical protein
MTASEHVYPGLMPISRSDINFLNGPFKTIEGWCIDEAAWLTTHLIRFQQAKAWVAPAYEIGVYKGKYLSVLANCLRAPASFTVGFDIYEWVSVDEVTSVLTNAFGSLEGIRLVAGDSTQMDAKRVMDHLDGQLASFISVDGSHEPEPVYSDLVLSEATLQPWGIVAIDDFVNSAAIGVVDGAMRFLHTSGTELVPFCYCQNKLFLSAKDTAPDYSEAVYQFCEENPHLPKVKALLENKVTRGLHWVKQRFVGQQIWTI